MRTRPKRASVKNAEWRITAVLVQQTPDGERIVTESIGPLVIADSWFNEHHDEAGPNIARFVDDQAQRAARQQQQAERLAKASKGKR